MKTAVITGATSGIGLAVAKTLCRQGYAILGVGRSQTKCDAALKQIKTELPKSNAKLFCGDLAQQTDVNRLAEQISQHLDKNHDGKLDVLINNAGGVRNWYTTTHEGYETQFALNHLAGFLLTHRLLPHLSRAQGKMILTGSDSHKLMKMRWRDIMFKKRYSCLYAYKQSKLANLLFAKHFNDTLSDSNVRAYVVDPGLVNTDIGSKDTSGFVSWFWSKRAKHGVHPSVSAQTYAYICSEPNLTDLYYYRCEPKPHSKRVNSAGDAQRLWQLSEQLCNIDYKEALS
ncbi:MAG: SDR family NAD(P)-dependent oxidoreductase [Clostridia bacterium]|jgi:NAD(P)-dependent dehydrogenase (short-subunit alcohol dehydrogenase family)|nr:SDR family NAD(P)-dependent oxidoreductase [Clostridia bacterium]MBT7122786.1 SDR family NAD(P)-dependent oxidoreductase [Clostridia bacterium]